MPTGIYTHTHTHTLQVRSAGAPRANVIQLESGDTFYTFPVSSCMSSLHLKTHQTPEGPQTWYASILGSLSQFIFESTFLLLKS